MKNTDKAILLNRISYSESSLILTFYTAQSGLQKFIFQGGKKKAHQLFPLSISEITFYKRPDSDLGKLTAVEPQILLNEVLFNPVKSSVAYFMAEVLLKCLKTEESESAVFTYLENLIVQLNNSENVANFPLYFLLGFSQQLGIYPHQLLPNARYFNLGEGIFTNTKPQGDIYYEGEAVLLILALMNDSIVGTGKKAREEALQILIQYYQLHIPQFKDIKSLEVIREILYG